MEMSSLGIRTSEPVELPVENPTLPGRILDLQQTEHGLSVDELVHAADLPDEFRIQHESVRPGLHAVK